MKRIQPSAARLMLPLSAVALLSLAVLLASGCDQPGTNAGVSTQTAAQGIDAPAASAAAEPAPAEAKSHEPVEIWEAYSMQGSRVGYAHTTIDQVVEDGQPLVRTQNQAVTTMKRGGQSIEQEMVLTSWDTPDGK